MSILTLNLPINLFPETFRTLSLNIFRKGGVAMVTC